MEIFYFKYFSGGGLTAPLPTYNTILILQGEGEGGGEGRRLGPALGGNAFRLEYSPLDLPKRPGRASLPIPWGPRRGEGGEGGGGREGPFLLPDRVGDDLKKRQSRPDLSLAGLLASALERLILIHVTGWAALAVPTLIASVMLVIKELLFDLGTRKGEGEGLFLDPSLAALAASWAPSVLLLFLYQ